MIYYKDHIILVNGLGEMPISAKEKPSWQLEKTGGFEAIFQNKTNITVGLISDTHMPGTINRLWPAVIEAFRSVDCILHAGDLHTASVIDELATLAPTFACYGNGDLGQTHPRLQDTWILDLGRSSVGLVHKFPSPLRLDESKKVAAVGGAFPDSEPDIIIYGHTHHAQIDNDQHTIYVNPGSATLPDNKDTRYGTIGFLKMAPSGMAVELHQISDRGISLIERRNFRRDDYGNKDS